MNPAIARRRHLRAANRQLRHDARQQANIHPQSGVNVGDAERQWSMIGGTALAVYGLTQRSISGFALAAIGGALIWRGHTGHCSVYQAMGHSSTEQHSQDNQTGHEPTPESQGISLHGHASPATGASTNSA